MNRLQGKTAIITGASTGIGATIAKELAVEGAKSGGGEWIGYESSVLIDRFLDKLTHL